MSDAKWPGGADVEVVGQLIGQVARSGVGQDEVAFDGQQEAAPVAASFVGPDLEGAEVSRVQRRAVWANWRSAAARPSLRR